MAEKILQSTTRRTVFRAYLASDGVSVATGKIIAITLSKNGGVFANPSAGATNATEVSNGFYYFDMSTTDTNTLGPLAWRGAEGTIHDAGDVYTVEAIQSVNVAQVAGQTANASAAVTFPATVASQTNLDVAVSSRLAAASYTAPDNSTISAIAGFVDTEVSAIKAKTDQLTFTVANQVDSNALTGGGGLDAAGVRAAVGLASANLDTQFAGILTQIANVQQATIKKGSTEKIPFEMRDSSDALVPGATVTAQRSIDGGALASTAGSVTAIGSGLYYLSPGTADTNAAEWGVLMFTAAGCKATIIYFKTSD